MSAMHRISGVSESGSTVIALAAAIKIAESGIKVLYVSNAVRSEDLIQDDLVLMTPVQAENSCSLEDCDFVFIDTGNAPSEEYLCHIKERIHDTAELYVVS